MYVKRSLCCLFGVLFLTSVTGCVQFERISPAIETGDNPHVATQNKNIRHYEKNLSPIVLERVPYRDSKYYDAYRLSTPSSGTNEQPGNVVSGEYLASRGLARKKLVIIVPIYGSSSIPPENLAMHLTVWNGDADTNVLLLHGTDDLFNWNEMAHSATLQEFLDEVDASARRITTTITDVRRLIDWAETRPEIDPKRIGIAGLSISAMIGSMVMGTDPRVAAGVFAMGGGNWQDIFVHCTSEDVATAREHVMRSFGLAPEELRIMLEQRLRAVNPMHVIGHVNTARVLIVDSLYDDFIPRSTQDALWRALGKPERITLKYAHKEAFLRSIIGLHFTERVSATFFKEKL